jgi:phosphoribosylformylglycinamidine synthase
VKPRVLILRAAGTNCDLETQHAFELAGAEAQRVHINRLIESPSLIDDFQILAIPGGFSYGDDIAAGKILASQLMLHLGEVLHRFVDAGKPVAGICNGFQVLVKTNLLPGPAAGRTGQTATLVHNHTGRFVDQWVTLDAPPGKCVWTRSIKRIEMPIAHGEGRFVPADDAVRKHLHDNGQIALVYAGENPNGSTDGIAGVCDATGLVFGLMPHPERHVSPMQHYNWTGKGKLPETAPGLEIFKNAVAAVG